MNVWKGVVVKDALPASTLIESIPQGASANPSVSTGDGGRSAFAASGKAIVIPLPPQTEQSCQNVFSDFMFFLETSRRATGVYPAVAMILASKKTEVDNADTGDEILIPPNTPLPLTKRKSENRQTVSNEKRQKKRELDQVQNGM